MARTAEGRRLTDRHRRSQLAIRAGATRDFIRLWPLWNGDERSFDRLVAATLPLAAAYRQTSSSTAAGYYETFRRAERVGGAPTPRTPGPLDRDRVRTSLHIVGRTMTRKAVMAGQSPQAAMQTALTRTSGAVGRHVLDGGRDTLILSSAADGQARGWQRVTSGEACAFCGMLASRGAVYFEDTGSFQAHDHCACSAEPAYAGSSLPESSQRYREMWDRAQREGDVSGTANDSLNNFRRLLAAQ